MQVPAAGADVISEGRVGPGGGNHRIAGRGQHPDEIAKQAVYAFADDQVPGIDAVKLRERAPDGVRIGVGVFPGVIRVFPDGEQHTRGGTGEIFVGAEPGGKRCAAFHFDLLRADEGHSLRQRLDGLVEPDADVVSLFVGRFYPAVPVCPLSACGSPCRAASRVAAA